VRNATATSAPLFRIRCSIAAPSFWPVACGNDWQCAIAGNNPSEKQRNIQRPIPVRERLKNIIGAHLARSRKSLQPEEKWAQAVELGPIGDSLGRVLVTKVLPFLAAS
jgi:hypothetical protein